MILVEVDGGPAVNRCVILTERQFKPLRDQQAAGMTHRCNAGAEDDLDIGALASGVVTAGGACVSRALGARALERRAEWVTYTSAPAVSRSATVCSPATSDPLTNTASPGPSGPRARIGFSTGVTP